MQDNPEDNLKKLELVVGMINSKSTNLTSEEILLRKIEKLHNFIVNNWTKLMLRDYYLEYDYEEFKFNFKEGYFKYHAEISNDSHFEIIINKESFYIAYTAGIKNTIVLSLSVQKALIREFVNVQILNVVLEKMENAICMRLCNKSLSEINVKP